ncbi:50S ribosomal protein L24 [Candidatus Woesearchaeota archaeon]|nr:50S ribosomal protein L24 [Candidatus Woesearchaeota archaeon]
MKIWSKLWKASKNRSKQRKYSVNAPKHTKRKLMGANLSKDMRKKHGLRSVPLRNGDKIKIMRGRFKGQTGTIERVDIDRSVAYITGIEVVKRDGSKAAPPVQASNMMIVELNTNDKKRLSGLKKSAQDGSEQSSE